MGLNRSRLKRLEEKAQLPSVTALQEEAWAREAMRHLTDQELDLLAGALERGFDPEREHQDVPVSPEEEAAYARFSEFYEEVKRGF